MHDEPSPAALDDFVSSQDYVEMIQKYNEFLETSRSGNHESTAKYWITYIDLIQLHQLFSRATRTNDLDLFTYCLQELCCMFCATNHPKYARYMVRYHLNLLSIEQTHPGAREMLLYVALSVRRTSKRFTRTL